METDRLNHAWQATLATLGAFLGAEWLERFSQAASIFAHIGTGLAGVATAVYTIYWLVKGRRKP